MNSKLLILCCSLMFCSCFAKYNVSSSKKDIYDFKIKFSNNDYLGNIKIDSTNCLRFRLYDNSGLKFTDFYIYTDSIKFNYCIADKIENSITDYFYVYNHEIIIKDLLMSIFKGISIKKSSIKDYNYDFEISDKDGFKYNISSLKNNSNINLCSKNYSFIDSIVVFKDVNITVNSKYKIQLISINE